MAAKLRFAPSPTGRIHIGNVRTAVLNALYARKNSGELMLRLDDTDRERSTDEFAQGIRDDLNWLGISWSSEARQSDRTERYQVAAEALKKAGRLYACYESADELDRKRKRQLGRGMPPVYDRASLKLTAAERAAFEEEGRKVYWRFRLDNTASATDFTPQHRAVTWNDLVRGEIKVDAGSLSDPVLQRADGSFLYTFTSVIDDIDFGITHIVRGEDHVTNTGVQIQIFQALGATVPAFAHHSLLVGRDGQTLSKRLGSLSIEGMRDDGIEPMAVACHAALVGTSDAIEIYPTLQALSVPFSLSKISRAPGRFDTDDLVALNAKLLHGLSFAEVEARLIELGVGGGEPFWHAVRGNIRRLSDTIQWWQVVSGSIAPIIENGDFCAIAAGALPAEPWSEKTWDEWTAAVKTLSGAKGRALFHPIRLALTGRDAGPELKVLLPLMGRTRVEHRLRGQLA